MKKHPSGKAWKLMVGTAKVSGGSSWRRILHDFRGPWEKRSLRDLYDRPQQHPVRLREIAKDARAIVERAMREQDREYISRREELNAQLDRIDRFVADANVREAYDRLRKTDDGGEAIFAQMLADYTLENA